jgi:hypothetical protein
MVIHKLMPQKELDILVPERSEQCDLFRQLGNLVLACAVAIVGTPEAAAKWLLALWQAATSS